MKSYDSILQELTIEEKIGQMLMIGFKEEVLLPEVQCFINDYNIGFIDVFARNITSIEQSTTLMNQIHQQGKIPPMIFSDQEGGIVCQFAELTSTFTSHMGLAATGNTTFVKLAAEKIAEDVKLIGLDGLLAPTIDVNHKPDNPIIGVRSFSDDVQTVLTFGKAFMKGIHQAGLASMPKHFPGHGGSILDSHLVLPFLEFSEEFYRAIDMHPFKEISKEADFMMTAHVAVPSIDPTGLPATFSKKFLTEILRKEFDFNGVLVADCLEMNVIKNSYSTEEIIEYSIEAGIDVLLFSHNLETQKEAYNILLENVKSGKIPEERIDLSVKRILIAKEKYGKLFHSEPIDISTTTDLLRKDREIENLVCSHSIVVLRDKFNKIPLKRDQKIGIIEWDKTRSTIQIYEPTHTSYLEEFAKLYFSDVQVLIFPLKKPESAEIKNFVSKCDNLLVAPFSRTPEIEMIQANAIREIMKYREDAIFIATGNPYDIRHFPEAQTYITTFGFRNSQMKALFDILTGKAESFGKLPVAIDGIFPRWYNNSAS